MGRNGGKFPLFQFGSIISDTRGLEQSKREKEEEKTEKSPHRSELPPIVRTAQKSLYVGKYEILSGVAQRERRHSSF